LRLDVFFTPGQVKPGDLAGRLVAVVDVLRASTSIAAALGNDARTIIPLEGADEVIVRSKDFTRSQIILAGEQKMLPIPGFDLGNSPQAFTRDAVEGKTILITTTNGTRALLGVQGARDIVIASYVNFTAVLTMMKIAAGSNTDSRTPPALDAMSGRSQSAPIRCR
jgi:2-phosphosulfolactate phosphatase